MFKYTATLLIASMMAASVALAVSIPTENRTQELAADSSNVVHKKHVHADKMVLMSEVMSSLGGDDGGSSTMLQLGLSALLEAVSTPKKIIGAIASYAISKLKSLDLKRLVKITLLAALVSVLTAVATVSVAGIVSIVSAICSVLPYLRLVFSGHHHKDEAASESKVDIVSEFMMGAFEKYNVKRKA